MLPSEIKDLWIDKQIRDSGYKGEYNSAMLRLERDLLCEKDEDGLGLLITQGTEYIVVTYYIPYVGREEIHTEYTLFQLWNELDNFAKEKELI
jgi:hypothetical protein